MFLCSQNLKISLKNRNVTTFLKPGKTIKKCVKPMSLDLKNLKTY